MGCRVVSIRSEHGKLEDGGDAGLRTAVPEATQHMTQLGQVVGRVFFGFSLVCFAVGALIPQPGFGSGPPSVAITHPENGAAVGAEVWVDAVYQSISGRPIVRLEFLVDDQVARTYTLTTPKTQGEISFSYLFQSPAGEAHKLAVRAVDSGGSAGIASITVTVKKVLPPPGRDDVPPVVNIYYPRPGEQVSGTVEVKVDARDNVGVEWVFFYVDGRIKAMIKGAPPYIDRWDTTKTTDGEHVLQARAWDAAENEGRSAEVRVVVANREATALKAGGAPAGGREMQARAPRAATSAVAAPTGPATATETQPVPTASLPSQDAAVIPVPVPLAAPKQSSSPTASGELARGSQGPLLAGAAQPKIERAGSGAEMVAVAPQRLERPTARDRSTPAALAVAASLAPTAHAGAAALAVPRREVSAGAEASHVPRGTAAPSQAAVSSSTRSAHRGTSVTVAAAVTGAQLAGSVAPGRGGRAFGASVGSPLSDAPTRMASGAATTVSLPITSALTVLAPVGARADVEAAPVRTWLGAGPCCEVPKPSAEALQAVPAPVHVAALSLPTKVQAGLASAAKVAPRQMGAVSASLAAKPEAEATPGRRTEFAGATTAMTDLAPQAAEAYLMAALPKSRQGVPMGVRSTTPGPRSEAEGRVTVLPLALSRFRDVQVVFDGKLVPLRACPEAVKGIPMGPLREIFAQTDGILYWFPADKRVRGVSPRVTLDLRVGQREAKVNGDDYLLDLAPYIKQGRTMVPLSFLADVLGLTITFDSERGQLIVKTGAP